MTTDTILIVDDNTEARAWVVESARHSGDYAWIEAGSLSEARTHLKTQLPQLMILAAQLDNDNGWQLLSEYAPTLPILITTTRRSADEISAALAAGARDVLVKPFEPERLTAAMKRALHLTRLQRERDALREQVDRQTQEFNALYTVGKTISSLLNIDDILTLVVWAAVNLTGAEQGSLMLHDPVSGELYLRAQFNLSAKTAQKMRVKVNDTLIGRVVQTGRPIMLSGNELLRVQTSLLVKAILGVPLFVGDKVIGVLTVDNQFSPRGFGKHDVHLMVTLADSAAIAIENARLFTAAERERAKLDTILREMQDLVIVTDENLRVLLINAAARQALYLDNTAIGLPLSKIVNVQQVVDLFEQRHAEDFVWRADITLPDGRVLQGQLSPLPGVGYGAVLRDITRLKELDRIKSEFVSIVSHDLRTPLTAIRGYVSLLPRVGPLNEQQQDFVTRVERSMDSIVDLIADLLDIGKIEAGVDWEMKAVPLHTVVRDVVERLRANADMHHQTLRVKVPDLSAVMGNLRRLEQVAANLIGNAIKYTPDQGCIDVSLHEDDGFLVLQVSDTGIGISLEDQRHIFDKFYRVESEATEKISGTGLGLSIVKAIIKKHSGRVWVHSELGKGSTFTVLLPRYVEEKKPDK
ncbi:MAG TPA: ATP-binding protein [Anaerolineae bacterium]|nr:ATP-binding protein [Anaerolineae bacterium]